MKAYITERAAWNISEIGRYIARESPAGSRRVRSRIRAAIRLASEHPHAGFLTATDGIRRIVVPHFGYLVFYTVDEARDEVVVLSVKHPAQRREYDID